MHNAAFREAGLNGAYEARRVTAAELPEAVQGLRQTGVLGANLSLPHKEAVLPLLDELSPAARAIGAVNTIVQRAGWLTGDNTDAPGLLAALADAGYAPNAGADGALDVVVLGAGGAARAAVYAALSTGFLSGGRVLVINRTPARAEALAQAFRTADTAVQAVQIQDVQWARVGLIINSSSAGLNAPEESPLPGFDFSRLPRQALVYDMVYKPAQTRLMRDAAAAGLRTQNGLGMLAHQARLAFAAWTERDVPVTVFLGALQTSENAGGSA